MPEQPTRYAPHPPAQYRPLPFLPAPQPLPIPQLVIISPITTPYSWWLLLLLPSYQPPFPAHLTS
jgi:hypothetical protein